MADFLCIFVRKLKPMAPGLGWWENSKKNVWLWGTCKAMANLPWIFLKLWSFQDTLMHWAHKDCGYYNKIYKRIVTLINSYDFFLFWVKLEILNYDIQCVRILLYLLIYSCTTPVRLFVLFFIIRKNDCFILAGNLDGIF